MALSTCDEPVVDRFLPACEWCGHAYDDGPADPRGLSGPDDSPPGSALVRDEAASPGRELLGLVALLSLLGAALAWFAWVVR